MHQEKQAEARTGRLQPDTKDINSINEKSKMKIVCAWCGADLGLRRGPDGTLSHGICTECLELVG